MDIATYSNSIAADARTVKRWKGQVPVWQWSLLLLRHLKSGDNDQQGDSYVMFPWEIHLQTHCIIRYDHLIHTMMQIFCLDLTILITVCS